MNRLLLLSVLFYSLCLSAQDNTAPTINSLTTPWTDKVNPSLPLPEYPRPQLVRNVWMNLNGPWDYLIQPRTLENTPAQFAGKITVPFAVESRLSSVQKKVGKDSVLWYRRSFTVPRNFSGRNVLLHFGAVDWQADVWVNGQKAGSHQGGYDPFSFNVTPHLKRGGAQEIIVRVWDPTDDGPQPRGKQVKKPESIWYTPVTGIWQTVWLEAVPSSHIVSTRQTPNVDEQVLSVSAQIQNAQAGDKLRISAWDGTTKVAEENVDGSSEVKLKMTGAKLWSPQTPFLYGLRIALMRNGKVMDEARSYFAMRKIAMAPDNAGMQRMLLNNAFLFQYGPLDQGWWPDGLYTAPTDDALKFDIVQTKAMGFNMIRKHVKVEPARWYYYCDSLGMLVWQDMPSGDLGNRWDSRPGVYGRASDKARTQESENIFRSEWQEIMQDFHNFPSIVVWVPFNEAWGQFKTADIVKGTIAQDASRLVNSASGGNFEPVGHIMDLHNYPDPAMPQPELFGAKQVLVLGEFGGLGLPLEGHTWQEKNNWGYQSFKNKDDLQKRYTEMINRLPHLIERGLSAAVYTQTTDVEVEVNGLMTYDRRVTKMPADQLAQLHAQLYASPRFRIPPIETHIMKEEKKQ